MEKIIRGEEKEIIHARIFAQRLAICLPAEAGVLLRVDRILKEQLQNNIAPHFNWAIHSIARDVRLRYQAVYYPFIANLAVPILISSGSVLSIGDPYAPSPPEAPPPASVESAHCATLLWMMDVAAVAAFLRAKPQVFLE